LTENFLFTSPTFHVLLLVLCCLARKQSQIKAKWSAKWCLDLYTLNTTQHRAV